MALTSGLAPYYHGVMAKTPIRVGGDHEKRYPGADALATECAVNLLRTESLFSTAIGALLRRYGLSIATFNVLMILEGAGEPLCPWQIGERLLVTRGTVTGLLDSLEKQDLIRRSVHPDDRRMLQIEATPKARALLDELLPEHFPAEAELMAGLSTHEKQTLVRLLGKLQVHLEQLASRAEPVPAGRAR